MTNLRTQFLFLFSDSFILMGDFMAFGVKIKSIKTKNSYSIESFYEAIKDKKFTAGEPSLTKHGAALIITFPPLDSQNQVWIVKSGFNKESNKFSVQKAEQAGLDNAAANAMINMASGGLFSFGSFVCKKAKQCEKLVEETAKELDEMGL